MPRRLLHLLLAAWTLAVVANAAHPRGLRWSARVDASLSAQALRAGVEPLRIDDVERLLRQGSVVLVDARPAHDHAAGRLPAARSLPLDRAALGPRPFGRAERVVVYCGTEHCTAGLALATLLRRDGFTRVALFVDGYDAWVLSGRTVDRG